MTTSQNVCCEKGPFILVFLQCFTCTCTCCTLKTADGLFKCWIKKQNPVKCFLCCNSCYSLLPMVLGCTLFLLYHHRRNNHTEAHPLMLFFFAIAHSDVWRWRESCLSLPSHQSASCVQQFLCDCRHKSVLKAWCVYKNQHSTREVCSISRNTAHSGGPEDPTDTQHRRWFGGCSCIVLSNFTCLVTFKCRVCGCVPPMQLFCKTGVYISVLALGSGQNDAWVREALV